MPSFKNNTPDIELLSLDFFIYCTHKGRLLKAPPYPIEKENEKSAKKPQLH